MVVCMKDVTGLSPSVLSLSCTPTPTKINDIGNKVIKVVISYFLEVIKISRN